MNVTQDSIQNLEPIITVLSVLTYMKGGNYTGKRVLSAVRIHRAKVVDCPRYLQGLWDMLLNPISINGIGGSSTSINGMNSSSNK